MINVLMINPGRLQPSMASGDRRAGEIIAALADRGRVTLFQRTSADRPDDWVAQAIDRSGGTVLFSVWKPSRAAFLSARFTHVIYEFWHLAEQCMPLGRQLLPWAEHIVDSVDVHYVREASEMQYTTGDPAAFELRKQRELDTYAKADRVIVVSDQDGQELRNSDCKTALSIIPNIVPEIPRSPQIRQKELLFVGGFGHRPNVDGLLWFVRECWPAVLSRQPDAVLTVVGSRATDEVLALNGGHHIRVVGFVPDTAPFLQSAAVSIAPLRFGGGMKGKVCEALAAAMPLVTTRCGAQGLPLVHGKTAMIADSASDFADAVIELLQRPEEAEIIGIQGQAMVRDLCSRDAARKRVDQLLATSRARQPSASERLQWWARAQTFKAERLARSAALMLGLGRLNKA